MDIPVTEATIVEALDAMRMNDTARIRQAGDYLLYVIKNPTNLMILFTKAIILVQRSEGSNYGWSSHIGMHSVLQMGNLR